MIAQTPIGPELSDAYMAASTALALNAPSGVVSTRTAIRAIRSLSPACRESDEDLVRLIVTIAAGRTLGVTFDHRQGER